jgi:hypothetical protein
MTMLVHRSQGTGGSAHTRGTRRADGRKPLGGRGQKRQDNAAKIAALTTAASLS